MKRQIQTLIGLLLGLGLVWLLFRDTNWKEVGAAMREIHWGWILILQIPLWLSFPLRILRWGYIVRATEKASFRHMFAATQIGFLANFTLPARLGEVIRALVLTRLTSIKFSKAFAMVALDRVTDLFGLIAIVLVAVFAFQPEGIVTIPAAVFGSAEAITFPASQYRAGAWGVGLVTLVILGGFVALYISKRWFIAINDAVVGAVSKRLAKQLRGMIDLFAEGLHVFRSPSDMSKAIFFSILVWLCAVLIAVALLQAFRIDAPWYTAFVMQALLAIFIAAPGAPGLVGQYHVPLVICLVMIIPDIDVDRAKAFAIVGHLLNFPPLIALAAYSFFTEDLRLSELGRASVEEAEQSEPSEGA